MGALGAVVGPDSCRLGRIGEPEGPELAVAGSRQQQLAGALQSEAPRVGGGDQEDEGQESAHRAMMAQPPRRVNGAAGRR